MNLLKDISELSKSFSKRVILVISFLVAMILALLVFAVVHSYMFSKEPRYVFGMKFGPEKRFETNYDPSKFFKFREGDQFHIHQYNAVSFTLKLSSVECMEFAEDFFNKRGFYNEVGSSNHVFASVYPRTYRSASISVRCTEYSKRGVTDVTIMGAGLDNGTVKTLVTILDRKYEEGFLKVKTTVTFPQ